MKELIGLALVALAILFAAVQVAMLTSVLEFHLTRGQRLHLERTYGPGCLKADPRIKVECDKLRAEEETLR